MMDDIEELIGKLAAPTYSYRMAQHDTRKGADKRKVNAKKEIYNIVMDYADASQMKEQIDL